MRVCKTYRLRELLVSLIAVSTLFLCATASAQTDPGPRPVGSSDICPLPNAKFPTAPNCIDNAQPADANGNGGAGNVVSFNSNLTTMWFFALTVFATPATVTGPQTGGSSIPGLGPSFNATSCFQCHSQPTVGGSSPNTKTPGFPNGNPQVGDAPTPAQLTAVSSFITANGPVREARFVRAVGASGSRDAVSPGGTVAELFVVNGVPGCTITQEDFPTQLANNNVIFRIPIPTFGEGFVENTPDMNLRANLASDIAIGNNINLFNPVLGIGGKFNISGNDSTISRFGWKAQNKSLLMFSGEAFNVEMGVDNELFPNEKTNGNGTCLPNATDFQPEDQVVVPPLLNPPPAGSGLTDPRTVTQINNAFGPSGLVSDVTNDIDNFAVFMRLNAAPGQCAFNSKTGPATGGSSTVGPAQCFSLTCTSSTAGCVNPNPSASAVASIQRGLQLFGTINPAVAGSFTSVVPPPAGTLRSIGCVLCHSDLLTTTTSLTPELNNASFSPFSDFALHTMDPTLADGVTQGSANGSQFRTAPLWGIGQRLFFLHDGRDSDLLSAITDHAPTAGTSLSNNCAATPNNEACQVIVLFNSLPNSQKQDILNFLRSL